MHSTALLLHQLGSLTNLAFGYVVRSTDAITYAACDPSR